MSAQTSLTALLATACTADSRTVGYGPSCTSPSVDPDAISSRAPALGSSVGPIAVDTAGIPVSFCASNPVYMPSVVVVGVRPLRPVDVIFPDALGAERQVRRANHGFEFAYPAAARTTCACRRPS